MNPKQRKLNAHTKTQKLEGKSSLPSVKSNITFSFEFCSSNVGLKAVKANHLEALLQDLSTLSKKQWVEVLNQPKETPLGYEQIPFQKSRFSKPLPQGYPEDVSKVDVFRICKQKARLIGKKSSVEPALFYVFWVDFDFSVYSHG